MPFLTPTLALGLIGAFDFTPARASVDIEAMAARFNDPEFWRRSMREETMRGASQCSFYLFEGLGINSLA